MANNEFRIDLAGNPQVADFFSDKKPGDTCEFTIKGKVKDVNTQEAVVSINKLSYEEDGEKEEVKPEPGQPMMMKMAPPMDATEDEE